MSDGTTGREGLSVAVPVLFLDERMPELKDTELRVLLVVLRQTQVAGREVASTWLTHSALCKRTGRASEAVSAAIDKLVREGMLQVCDESGLPLNTSAARRRAEGKRYYRVGNLGVDTTGDSGKAKTIVVKEKSYSFRKIDPIMPRFDCLTGDAENTGASPETRDRIESEKARIRERLKRLPGRGLG